MYKNQLKALEKVQRRVTKLLPEIRDKTYKERLIDLKLPSIKFRQIRGDLIQTFKIINNIDNLDCSDFFSFYDYHNKKWVAVGLMNKFNIMVEYKMSTRSPRSIYETNNKDNKIRHKIQTNKKQINSTKKVFVN